VAVQVVEAAGASVVVRQVAALMPGSGSVTAMPVSVTLPRLVTVKV
jgi:hypothetical protein